MNLSCSIHAVPPPGGTVLNLSAGGGMLWAASPAGLFRQSAGAWRALPGGQPFLQPGLVLAHGRTLLAAGLDGGLARSVDSGASWVPAWIPQSKQPITCLLASPRFDQDTVLLAGTAGDGLLRSRDAGRSWELCNFGLRSFAIFALAAPAAWAWREPVFAGSQDGVYHSPNGGRAWKFSGLAGEVVLSLALHPAFPKPPLVLAGLEGHGLARSSDGGATWQTAGLGLPDGTSVNAILFSGPETVCLGTSEHGVLVSADGGQTWTRSSGAPATVFCLASAGPWSLNPAVPPLIYCGAYAAGLFSSADGGRTWQPAELAARRFVALAGLPGTAGSPAFVAAGPGEGLWRLDPQAAWQPLPFPDALGQPAGLHGDDAGLWVGSSSGLFHIAQSHDYTQIVESASGILTTGRTIEPAAGHTRAWHWAAGAAGDIWLNQTGQTAWQHIPPPAAELVGLASTLLPPPPDAPNASPRLLLAAYDEKDRQVRLWQGQRASTAGGWEWQLALSEPGAGQPVHLGTGTAGSNTALLSLGTHLWRLDPSGWQPFGSIVGDLPVSALCWWPAAACWLVAAGQQLFTSAPIGHLPAAGLPVWQPLSSIAPAPIVSLLPGSHTSHAVYALTAPGHLLLLEHQEQR